MTRLTEAEKLILRDTTSAGGRVSKAIDFLIDRVETLEDKVDTHREDTNEATGFIHDQPLTMGIVEACLDGTNVISKDGLGNVTTRADGKWSDGTTANPYEVSISTYNSNAYCVYVEGTKFIGTTRKTVNVGNTSGLKCIYFDVINGELELISNATSSPEFSESMAVVGTVYVNASVSSIIQFSDDRHGIQMDGATHKYLHFTEGAKYVSGMEVQGLVEGSTTFTQISSGSMFDEDIFIELATQYTAPCYYLEGTVWNNTTDDAYVALLDTGTAQYNSNIGTEANPNYILTDVVGNDCMIVFIVATSNINYPYIRMVGQQVYDKASVARTALPTAINDLSLVGLPSPEFLPVAAIIVDADGGVVENADGEVLLDLRTTKVTGQGISSIPVTNHQDLTGLDSTDSHPIDSITGLTTTLADILDRLVILESN